ncbi:hypothetical protein H4S06_004956 [Coemansia sp. BCRC 34490]|nr:hypothetical protein H4S06_004956 [Coemansia sp. BCRC 34490]
MERALLVGLNVSVSKSSPVCVSSPGQVTSGQLISGQLTSGHVTSGQVTSGQLTSGQVTSDQLNVDHSTSGQLTSGNVTLGRTVVSFVPVTSSLGAAVKSSAVDSLIISVVGASSGVERSVGVSSDSQINVTSGIDSSGIDTSGIDSQGNDTSTPDGSESEISLPRLPLASSKMVLASAVIGTESPSVLSLLVRSSVGKSIDSSANEVSKMVVRMVGERVVSGWLVGSGKGVE